MNRRCRFLLLTSIVLILSSCSPARFYSSPGDDVYLLADYRRAVERWTENAEINSDLIQLASANCLYRGWEVQQAYLRTVKVNLNPPKDRYDRIVQREMNKWRNGNEFLLGLYCYEDEWNNITGTDSKWNISFVSDDGRIITPDYIEKIDLPAEEAELYLDTIANWRDVYRLIFPLVDENGNPYISKTTDFFEIHCNSMLGEMILRWELNN